MGEPKVSWSGRNTPADKTAPGVAALRVSRSSHLERLAAALAGVVSAPLASTFTAETIVVPTRAMGEWVALRLAEKLGVWANPRFVTLERFVAELAGDVGSQGEAAGDAFDVDGLAWAIAAALPALLAERAFAPVAAYLDGDVDTTKRHGLARRLGGTFARYMRHRPEMLLAWERGSAGAEAGAEAHPWQSALWCAVVRRLGSDHPARRATALLERLRSRAAGAALDVPERVTVFAPEGVPSVEAEILAALAAHAPVHVFVRVSMGHPLAPSLGARGSETLAMMAARSLVNVVDLDAGAAPRSLPPHVSVHACHGPMREAEVLRDQVLAALNDDPSLEPRDVVVLCPDLATYAPAIDAAFGVAEREPTFLPYRIVDQPMRMRRQLRVVEAFLALLDLAPSRMTAPDVVDLLAREPVRARFDLDESALDAIRGWVAASGIRWGEDEAHRAAEGQPALRANTWRFGLDRLLLGYATSAGEPRALCAGTLPYEEIEGTASAPLGGFAAFCEALFVVRHDLAGRKSLAGWRDRLLAALGSLFHASWETEAQHQRIRRALDRIVQASARAGDASEVPLAVVKDALVAELDDPARTLDAPASGITFAAYASARCVPARVVALLGMNDGDVPRAPHADAFDLLGTRWLPGDPSARDDDRQTLLDALLCARERLVVTYVGQSISTNAERAPSVLVSELLDVMSDAERKAATVRHHLHAFSPAYFGASDDPRLFSHAAALCAGAQAMRGARRNVAPFVDAPLSLADVPRTIELDELAAFFAHPVKSFMTTRLRVSFGSDAEVLGDREPLELDTLAQWKVGAEILARGGAGDPVAGAVPADLVAEGALPLGVVGAFAYATIARKVLGIAEQVEAALGGSELLPLRTFELEIGPGPTPARVVARLRHTSANTQVLATYSSISGKQRVSAWVRHVAMNAAGVHLPTVLVCKDDVRRFAPMTRDEATARLSDLVEIYRRGLGAPLLFFPDTSVAYLERLRARGGVAAMVEAERVFQDDYSGGACAYVSRAFGGASPLPDAFEPFGAPRDRDLYPSFTALAARVIGPMLAQERKG
jgi:exodeoxyribonuclease V gamma subunit